MANEWLRLWHDTPNDPKFKTIARISKQPISLVLAVFMHLLVDASKNVTRGVTSVTNEDLASALDVTDEQIEVIRTTMQGRVMFGNALTGWDSRQIKKEDAGDTETGIKSPAERQRDKREREKQAVEEALKDALDKECHELSRNVTLDTDKEEDKDKDKELKTTPITDTVILDEKPVGVVISPVVALAIAFRKAGVTVQPHNPKLIELAKQGVTPETVTAACADGLAAQPGAGFGYVLAIITRWSKEASEMQVSGAIRPNARASPGYKTPNEKAKEWADQLTGKTKNEQRIPNFKDLNTIDGSVTDFARID